MHILNSTSDNFTMVAYSMGPDKHARIQKIMSEGVQLFFFFKLIRGEVIRIPLKAGVIIGPLAKRHFKWLFVGGPMMARHVMLVWYMCSFEIFYGIWTSIANKTILL